MNDVHALSGAYAIDALDDIERAQFERHLAQCPECQAEVASLREASAVLAEASATAAPAALREKVLSGIATVRPLPPVVPSPIHEPVDEPAHGSRGRRFRPLTLAAAAAAVIALGAGGVVWQPWNDPTTSQSPTLSAVDQVLEADDAEQYVQEFPDGSSAVLTRSKSLNKAVIVTNDMAPPPEGKVYELWLDHEGIGMVPAGLMPVKADAVVLLEGDPATAVGAGITVEPAGGSEEPTGDTVALIPFENA
ncbi:anti-sigma factor domain-containing protein [Nocardioides sp. GCM10027113]|uniref:anti-sigma factor n=1 Tax=unclassified Nocardioides TaxID=2615069 RepID=UPI00361C0E67